MHTKLVREYEPNRALSAHAQRRHNVPAGDPRGAGASLRANPGGGPSVELVTAKYVIPHGTQVLNPAKEVPHPKTFANPYPVSRDYSTQEVLSGINARMEDKRTASVQTVYTHGKPKRQKHNATRSTHQRSPHWGWEQRGAIPRCAHPAVRRRQLHARKRCSQLQTCPNADAYSILGGDRGTIKTKEDPSAY